jgi:hypothetical protein
MARSPAGSYTQPGDRLELKQGNTLQFVKAGTVKVMFPVAAIGAIAPGTVAGGGGMMEHHGGMMQMKLAGDCTDRRPLLH